MAGARRTAMAGVAPLTPRQQWRAILLATLLLVPAYWSLLAGVVAASTEDGGGPFPGPYIAFGLMVIPFVFVVLAFLSQHPRAPGAVAKAMALTLLVGIPVSALAADAVTGVVAGIGAGGIVALRRDLSQSWKARALAVAVASVGVFLMARTAPEAALLLAPCLPFTSLGVADQLAERKASGGGTVRLPGTGHGS